MTLGAAAAYYCNTQTNIQTSQLPLWAGQHEAATVALNKCAVIC